VSVICQSRCIACPLLLSPKLPFKNPLGPNTGLAPIFLAHDSALFIVGPLTLESRPLFFLSHHSVLSGRHRRTTFFCLAFFLFFALKISFPFPRALTLQLIVCLLKARTRTCFSFSRLSHVWTVCCFDPLFRCLRKCILHQQIPPHSSVRSKLSWSYSFVVDPLVVLL